MVVTLVHCSQLKDVMAPSSGMFHIQASTPKLVFLVIDISFFLLIPFSTATTFENTTFKFDSFNLFTQDITYEGDAYASNHVLQLTANRGKNQTGGSCSRATCKEPIHLWDKSLGNLANFITNFSFAINSQNIIDLQNILPEWVHIGFAAATEANFETHTSSSWDFSCSLQISPNVDNVAAGDRSKTWYYWLVLGVAIASILVNIFVLVGYLMKRNGREEKYVPISSNQESEEQSRAEREFEKVMGHRVFSFRELDIATNKFAKEGMLGKGGSGSVYKGSFGGISVAVKKINPESQRRLKEYESEVNTIGQLSQRNLVRLIGWCCEEENLLIVYEFMPNKSLHFQLFEAKCLLPWEKRYIIALDLAWALFYLQENCEQCVLHRDIKSGNVLLDSKFNAKLGDFGLARIVDHGQGSQTTCLMGTLGYMAPEYFESGEATKESDTYSFGIVALEMASGKRAIEKVEEEGKESHIKLVEQVWGQYGNGNILKVADKKLRGNYDKKQMERLIVVGLSCAHPDYSERPSILQAIDMLISKAELPKLPSEIPVSKFVASQFNVSMPSD